MSRERWQTNDNLTGVPCLLSIILTRMRNHTGAMSAAMPTSFRWIALMNRLARLWLLPLFFGLLAGCASPSAAGRSSGPWNFTALSQPPVVEWGANSGLVQEVYYGGESFRGKPTRVFAYLGRPADRSVRRGPAMILVHGGGGKAFKAWAEHWAQRGYVALAMDLAGNGPNGRLPD